MGERTGPTRTYLAFKRLADILLALLGLVFAAPVMLAVAIAVRLRMGGPVLFRQERPGRGGRLFTLVKFRTMLRATDAAGRPLPDDQRLTALGRLLRRTSLDELPQLWNVLIGDMSLIGPRPLLPEYLPLYTPTQARRHELRPGITGWAQVHGRNATTWSRRLALDAWYVDHCSLAVDLRILWKTVRKVRAAEGVSAAGHATMPLFTGAPDEVAPDDPDSPAADDADSPPPNPPSDP